MKRLNTDPMVLKLNEVCAPLKCMATTEISGWRFNESPNRP